MHHTSLRGGRHLALLIIFVATLAAGANANSDRAARDAPIEKPAYRTTSFVPRLGKREPQPSALDRLKLDRLLCENYGLDCGRLLEELPRVISPTVLESTAAGQIKFNSNNELSPLAALIGGSNPAAQVIPISQELAASSSSSSAAADIAELAKIRPNNYDGLLDALLAMQRLEAREPRGSAGDLFNVSPAGLVAQVGGTKQVAFTPRIG